MKRTGFCIVAACVALAACNPQAPKTATSASSTPKPTATPLVLHVTGQGTSQQPVHFIQQIHNRVEYDLTASSFESRGSQGHTRSVFQNATVTFHGRDGSTMVASAPQAIVDESSNSVTLIDGVNARSGSGMTLKCDQLVYDHATQMLHGRGNVVIVDPKGFRGTGSSFDSDVSLTHMNMR